MIHAGDLIQQRVHEFKEKVRGLFYAVMLFQRECRSCGKTALDMERDSLCQCRECGAEFDPTAEFQTCADCDHALVLKTHHYWCPRCRRLVRSMFCFDERVFNSDYFCDMMRESRKRRKEQVEMLRNLLLDSRSPPCWLDEEPVLMDSTGFARDLDGFLTACPSAPAQEISNRSFFDTKAYRAHILSRVDGCVVEFDGISALIEDRRLDRVYRFITTVFLEHEGLLAMEQRHDGRIRLVGA
jgi:hypothetical protein